MKEKKSFDCILVCISCYIASFIVLTINPVKWMNTDVMSFDRQIGLGVLSGIDINMIIKAYSLAFLLFCTLFLVCFFIGKRIVTTEDTSDSNLLKAKKSIGVTLAVALCDIVYYSFKYYQLNDKRIVWEFGQLFVFATVITYVMYIVLHLYKKIDFEKFQIIYFSELAISFSLSLLLAKDWHNGIVWFFVFLLLVMISFIPMILIRGGLIEKKGFVYTLGISSVVYLAVAVWFEIVNVLNQKNIYIHNPKIGCLLIFLLLIICGIINYFCGCKFKFTQQRVLFLSIVGMATLAVQLWITSETGYDIFESSNYSVLITDFLKFHKIPILEHYGSHMLSNVVGGVIYGALNGDIVGAAFSPYAIYIYPVILGIVYIFLEKMLNFEWAFWITAMLPVYPFISYWGFALFVCILLYNFNKKSNWIDAILLWCGCVVITLYKLDVGVAFDIAIFLFIILFYVPQKQWDKLKRALTSMMVVIVVFGLFAVVLSSVRNIDLVSRIIEFVNISASNGNWAYGNLGDTSRLIYSWTYFILPILSIVCTISLLIYRDEILKYSEAGYVFTVVLGICYLANYTRCLVRHTTVEMLTDQMYLTAYMFLCGCVLLYCKKKYLYVMALMIAIIFNGLLTGNSAPVENNMFARMATNLSPFVWGWTNYDGNGSFWENTNERIDRVVVPEEVQITVETYKNITRVFLQEDETYIDLTNTAAIYPLIQKECPVYVSQTPGQISGELTQEMFINQLKEKKEKLPIAILPTTLCDQHALQIDGLANRYRYYKIFEYVYRNYEPLCQVDNVAIWCRKEIENRYMNLPSNYKKIDYGYDCNSENIALHSVNTGRLPYIWAKYDTKKAKSNTKIADLKIDETNMGLYHIADVKKIDKRKGNYLLIQINNSNEPIKGATITLTQDNNERLFSQYTFDILPGDNSYIFRISSDYLWEQNLLELVQLNADVTDVRMSILQGD